MLSLRRIYKEQENCQPDVISTVAIDSSPFDYLSVLRGPQDTPYEDGIYLVSLHYPEGYPYKPLVARLLTPILHPNISAEGEVSIDILRNLWSPALTMRTVLLSLEVLLSSPNFDDPLNAEAADAHRRDPAEFERRAAALNKKVAL